MKKTVLVEGILFLVLSFVGMGEALRLILTTQKNPLVISDVLGPGLYILFPSFALMIVGAIHLIINYGKNLSMKKVALSKEMKIRVISIVAIMALYVLLIDVVGYLVATIIFFLLIFKSIGIKSWMPNVILTIVLTAVYYVVFVQYCSMAFPRGIFFR